MSKALQYSHVHLTFDRCIDLLGSNYKVIGGRRFEVFDHSDGVGGDGDPVGYLNLTLSCPLFIDSYTRMISQLHY